MRAMPISRALFACNGAPAANSALSGHREG